MKTKALFAAGLMMAATAASSFAQTVYSVNAVGFVNVVFVPGFTLAANPLDGAANTIAALFPSVPNGSSIFKFDALAGNFVGGTFVRGSWGANGNLTLVPGEGFFFKNADVANFTATFVGNVKQSTVSTSLDTPLSVGFTLVGSQVPQSGLVGTDLMLPLANGDSVFKFDTLSQSYTGGSFVRGSWGAGGEPTIGVGEGFFVKKAVATTWSRTFSVNN